MKKRKEKKDLAANTNHFNSKEGVIPLQSGYVYGPINSRRLGNSLGINPFPLEKKICTFNCIYCQYGWTSKRIFSDGKVENGFPSIDKVKMALETRLENLKSADIDINYITFAGNGEPTLHPKFSDLVDMIRELRDEYYPEAKTAILSNSTTVLQDNVREGLHKLDRRIMKLDVGSQEKLIEINAPMIKITFKDIVEALKSLKDCTIQSLFINGRISNAAGKSLDEWIKAMLDIKPEFVQIYSIDRVPADRGLEIVSLNTLSSISKLLSTKNEIPSGVY